MKVNSSSVGLATYAGITNFVGQVNKSNLLFLGIGGERLSAGLPLVSVGESTARAS